MDGTMLTLLLNVFLLIHGISSVCIHVPNEDMIEYSCTGGRSSDLYVIPDRAEKIRIANMSLPRITSETFSRYGDNLWVLACSHCDIREITPDAFRTLVNLQQLRLDNNHLRDVKSSWFEGMKYLTYLDLNYNEIEHIEDGVYHNLPSLVDLRISGNRLECLNVEAMSNLADLKRMFLSKNPDFKCPNAVSKFLEDREVNFERDPEWRGITHDLVHSVPHWDASTRDWRTHPVDRSSTPSYHEKLIQHTTKDDSYESHDYKTFPPEVTDRVAPGALYPDREPIASSTASYPTRDWPPSVPTYDQTTRSWSSSMSNSYPYQPSPLSSTSSYPAHDLQTPTPTVHPNRERPEWRDVPPRPEDIHGSVNSQPEMDVTSTLASTINQRLGYIETSMTHSSSGNNETPPRIEWSGNTGEVFEDIDRSPIENIGSPSSFGQTNSPSSIGYPPNVHSPTERPSSPDDYYQPTRNSGDVSHPRVLDKYQQVQEPEVVAVVTPTKETTDKPLPECVNSSNGVVASLGIVAIGILLRSFATISN